MLCWYWEVSFDSWLSFSLRYKRIYCRLVWGRLLQWFIKFFLAHFLCCGNTKRNSGLWGWQCKASSIAKENCALRCLSPVCYELIYESDPVRRWWLWVFLWMIYFLFDAFCVFFCWAAWRRWKRFDSEPRIQILYVQVSSKTSFISFSPCGSETWKSS